MEKGFALGFALLTAGAVAGVILTRPGPPHAPAPAASASAMRERDGGPDASAASAPADAGPTDAGEPAPSGTDDPGSPDLAFGASDAGATLLNGTAPPSLAGDAPKSVVFGVILVQYKGAQGAPANARTRDAALELAKEIAADAKQDFKAAVGKGDKGSDANMGRMPRGMLEPAPEYVLFSLPKDGVSDPVDTPRGFWIVHRIE
jgi:PPIC-type PPIASE domain